MHGRIRIIGIGSPHGADQAGWLVAAQLERQPVTGVDVLVLSQPVDLLENLEDCAKLILVDAARSNEDASRVTRLCWPDERIVSMLGCSTHGVGVSYALQMAAELGRLPPEVIVYAIELGESDQPLPSAGGARKRIIEVARRIQAEISRWRGTSRCTSDH